MLELAASKVGHFAACVRPGSSFGVGRGLLDTSLDILTELDAFDAFITQFVNATAMLDALRCSA